MDKVQVVDCEAEASTAYRKFNQGESCYLVPRWQRRKGATKYAIHMQESMLERDRQYMLMLANERSYCPIIAVSNTRTGRLASVVVNSGFANMVEHGMAANDRIPNPNVPASLRLYCEGTVKLYGDNRYFDAPDTLVDIIGEGAHVIIPWQGSMFGTDVVVRGGARLVYGEGAVTTGIKSTGTVSIEELGSMIITANTNYSIGPGHALNLQRSKHCACY
ncbi:MAG: hypothetical protein LBD43_00415 [Holosporales bacterium]|nr:hypothetical protein [Holosporales bacterium]